MVTVIVAQSSHVVFTFPRVKHESRGMRDPLPELSNVCVTLFKTHFKICDKNESLL